ncbi:MAG: prolyl oligopeptidase family serine peptidase, partial [Planctomycetes bacterium]|nr:prolyl oligopeptidase family serine peptidase [Planctomycetota bacterium]
DPGAFGFTPWIDLDLGIGGVFAVKDRVRRVFDRLTGIMDRVRDVARSPLVAGTDESFTLHHDGRTRRYLLHVPAHDANSAGLPLVLVLHGGGGNGEIAAQSTGFAAVADREGFAVAFPDGTGKLPRRLLTWNDGVLPVYAVDREVDDVGFLREVVTDVARRVPIDAGRVFAVGHSNGGMMCHRLARDAADLFAGIAVVSGAMNYTAKDSAAAIGVVLVHGTADEHVPYLGGKPTQATGRAGEREDTSVQAAVDYYLARNGLLGYPDSSTDPQRPGVRVDTYGKDKLGEASWTPVRVITLEGGGHAWPSTDGKAPRRLLADRPFPFDASQAIWDFFTLVRRDGGVTARPGKTKGSPPAVPR